jgi:GTP-binding protein YchF
LKMKTRVGILGLPNVGKSTLFNAIARQSIAQAANFPFCTIDPNTAPIAVPDLYLAKLGTLAGSRRSVPATMDWIDVAGLAKGASRGEGLGNRFLATLRECDAICHVVRMFEDTNVIHVDGIVDPLGDAETIQLELLLADCAHVERRLEKTTCRGDERAALEQVLEGLHLGTPARAVGLTVEAAFSIKSMGLLTLKPVLYAFNVDEVDFTMGRVEALEAAKQVLDKLQYCDPAKDLFTVVSAQIESDLSEMTNEDKHEYLAALRIENEQELETLLCYNLLPNLVKRLLNLSLVYTGPGVPPERSQTTRAHLVASQTADGLAGRIHGEVQKGFMRAEVTPANELLDYSSYTEAKEAGRVRTEGRDYELNSDDVVLIKWK